MDAVRGWVGGRGCTCGQKRGMGRAGGDDEAGTRDGRVGLKVKLVCEV
jgi:hypothetical protein